MTNPEPATERRVLAEELARESVAFDIEDVGLMISGGAPVSPEKSRYAAVVVTEMMFDHVGEGESGKRELLASKLPSLKNIVSHASRRQSFIDEIGGKSYNLVQAGISNGVSPSTHLKWERATSNWYIKTIPKLADITVGIFSTSDPETRAALSQKELDGRAFFDNARRYAIKASRRYTEEGISSLMPNFGVEIERDFEGNEAQLQKLIDLNLDDIEYNADLNWLKNFSIHAMAKMAFHLDHRN